MLVRQAACELLGLKIYKVTQQAGPFLPCPGMAWRLCHTWSLTRGTSCSESSTYQLPRRWELEGTGDQISIKDFLMKRDIPNQEAQGLFGGNWNFSKLVMERV